MKTNLGKGFAGLVFDTLAFMDSLESVLFGALRDFFERTDAEVKRFDYYDLSVEFWCIPNSVLTDEEQETLWTLGFDRCWICYRETSDGPQTGEAYFYKQRKEAA